MANGSINPPKVGPKTETGSGSNCVFYSALSTKLDKDATSCCGTCGVSQMEFCALHTTFMKTVENMDTKVDQILSSLAVISTAIELSKLDRSVLRKDIDTNAIKHEDVEKRVRDLEALVNTGKGAMWMSKLVWSLVGAGVTAVVGFIVFEAIKRM